MSWKLSGNKWGRKPTRERGEVVWIDRSCVRPAPFVQNIERYDFKDIPEDYVQHLCVGSLWVSLERLYINVSNNPDMIVKASQRFSKKSIVLTDSNSLMIYAGTIRRDERENKGRIVSVSRHTFIINMARYIIVDFTSIKPIV